MNYTTPGVIVEETTTSDRPLTGVSTAVCAFCGIARRGPIGQPVKVTGLRDFRRKFGSAIVGEPLYYAVEGFFLNGGVEAYVCRLGHYTDPTDKTTLAAAAAVSVLKGIGAASPAKFTGDVDVTTVDLRNPIEAGTASITLDINDNGDQVVSFALTRASITGADGAFNGDLVGGELLTIRIDGGRVQSLTLANGDDASVAAAVAAINAQLEDGKAVISGGQIKIESDTFGSNSQVTITGLGAGVGAALGLAVGSSDAIDEWADDGSAVTFAEIKARIESTVKDTTAGDRVAVTQDSNGYLVLTVTEYDDDPADTEIDLSAAGASIAGLLGIDGLGSQGGEDVVVGAEDDQSDALKVFSGFRGQKSPGLDGNNLTRVVAIDPKRASRGVGLDIAANVAAEDTEVQVTSLTGFVAEAIVKFKQDALVEYAIIQKAESRMVGGVLKHFLTLKSPITNAFTAAQSTLNSVEHTLTIYENGVLKATHAQFSMNPLAPNYVVAMVNDPTSGSEWAYVEDQGAVFPKNVLADAASAALAGGTSEVTNFSDADVQGDSTAATGLHALNSLLDLNLLCVPPSFGAKTTIKANPAVHGAMLAYAAGRMDCFAILDAPEKATGGVAPLLPAEAVTYRNDTLGADTRWGAMYYPFLYVRDPIGVGPNPEVAVPPSGFIAGIFARTDASEPPDGGVSAAPAGEQFGKLAGVRRLAYEAGDAESGLLNDAGINAIRKFMRAGPNPPGVVVWGARTLSVDVSWRYIQVRRMMTYLEQTIKRGTAWAVFKKNGPDLWGRLKRRIEDYLRSEWENGQLAGKSVSEAFFVKIDEETTTVDDIENGRLIGLIGVALHRPAEFVIFRFTQAADLAQISEN